MAELLKKVIGATMGNQEPLAGTVGPTMAEMIQGRGLAPEETVSQGPSFNMGEMPSREPFNRYEGALEKQRARSTSGLEAIMGGLGSGNIDIKSIAPYIQTLMQGVTAPESMALKRGEKALDLEDFAQKEKIKSEYDFKHAPAGSQPFVGGKPFGQPIPKEIPDKDVNMPPAFDLIGVKYLGDKYQTKEGRLYFSKLYASNPKIQQEVAEQERQMAQNRFIVQPSFQFSGVDPNTGQPILLNQRSGQFSTSQVPGSGGIAPKNISEDYKNDITAINQAEDLVKGLRENWNKLGIKSRSDAVKKYGSGITGFNPDAKLYNDQREAFLGNLSRSIAAERGVLTNQDIARIEKAIPKIGANPFTVDNLAEGEKKWDNALEFVKKAKDRVGQRSKMTYSNPTGGNETKPDKTQKVQHVLTGKPAGRYDVDGRIIKWDGTKEIW
jgi:hypothetical protein